MRARRAPVPARGHEPWHPPGELLQALFDAAGTSPVLALRRGLAEARLDRARAALLGVLSLGTFVAGLYVASSDALAGQGLIPTIATWALTLALSVVFGAVGVHVLEDALTELDRAYRRAENELERALAAQERTARALARMFEEGAR